MTAPKLERYADLIRRTRNTLHAHRPVAWHWAAGRAALRLALAIALAAAAAGCGPFTSKSSTEVTYGVTGTTCSAPPQTATIMYQDLTETPITVSNEVLPWNTSFYVPADQVKGFPLYLYATNLCLNGSITANVEVNGSLYFTQSSYGLAPNNYVQIGCPTSPGVCTTTPLTLF